VPFDRSMAREKVDSRLIGFKVNGAVTGDTGDGNTALLDLGGDGWDISGNAELPLTYDAVVSAVSAPLTEERVLTVCFTVGRAQ
ncbi:MAG: hypothetical protein J5933_02940, partial [Clostridia bacterium]|nr:hypothetical protein [Clostridia bacterium]